MRSVYRPVWSVVMAATLSVIVPLLWPAARDAVTGLAAALPEQVHALGIALMSLDILCWCLLAYAVPNLIVGVVSPIVSALGGPRPPLLVRRMLILLPALWIAAYGVSASLSLDAIWAVGGVLAVVLPLSFIFRQSVDDFGAGVRLSTTGLLSEHARIELPDLGHATVVRLGVTSTVLRLADGHITVLPNARLLERTILQANPSSMSPSLLSARLTVHAHASVPSATLERACWAASLQCGVPRDARRPSVTARALDAEGVRYEVSLPIPSPDEREQYVSQFVQHLGAELLRVGIDPPGSPVVEPSKRRLIDAQDLFCGLSSSERAALAEAATVRSLAEGDVLCSEGEPGRCMWVVISGVLAVDSGDAHHGRIGGAHLVGELALLTGETRTATLSALSHVAVLELGFDAVQPIVQSRPELTLALAEYADSRDPLKAHAEPTAARKGRLAAMAEGISVVFGLRGMR